MSLAARLQSDPQAIPPLENGDRLTSDEFERRYEAMPDVKGAELIEGVVYMPSPVGIDEHAEPTLWVAGWLAAYVAAHPDVQGGDNATVRLDQDNNYQPDAILRRKEGGTSTIDRYIEGPPELAVEVSATSVSIDMHLKKNAYRRNGVQEYLVWRVRDGEIDWFELQHGEYLPIPAGPDGVVESRVFPGLRLNVPALLDGNLDAVLRTQWGE